MKKQNRFIGCFVSGPAVHYEDDPDTKNAASEKGRLFRTYVWGDKGISDLLKKLKNDTYGKDVMIILFQFYINPFPIELQNLRQIGAYRKEEKSIGIPIIIRDENFFEKPDEERRNFLKQSVLKKIDLLAQKTKRKKLDTKIDLLRQDIQELLNQKFLL